MSKCRYFISTAFEMAARNPPILHRVLSAIKNLNSNNGTTLKSIMGKIEADIDSHSSASRPRNLSFLVKVAILNAMVDGTIDYKYKKYHLTPLGNKLCRMCAKRRKKKSAFSRNRLRRRRSCGRKRRKCLRLRPKGRRRRLLQSSMLRLNDSDGRTKNPKVLPEANHKTLTHFQSLKKSGTKRRRTRSKSKERKKESHSSKTDRRADNSGDSNQRKEEIIEGKEFGKFNVGSYYC